MLTFQMGVAALPWVVIASFVVVGAWLAAIARRSK